MTEIPNLNFKTYGDSSKPKLVFLHGLMGYLQNWRSVIRKFEKDFYILALDQRGHGKSFQPESGYSALDYAEDLNKLLSHLAWEKILLVGHSMGGRNAIEFCSKYPQKVLALVVVDISPESNPESMEKIRQIFLKIPTPLANREEAKKLIFSQYDQQMANYLYANLEENEDGKMDWKFSKEGVLQSLEEGLNTNSWQKFIKIDCPGLVIRGEKSDYLSKSNYQRMLSDNPRFRGKVIVGAGHWVHSEALDRFCEEVRNFFKDLGYL